MIIGRQVRECRLVYGWKGGSLIHIICVDDTQLALDNFRRAVENMQGVKTLQTFQSGKDALDWARNHEVSAAFLETEMPSMHGLQLAKELHAINENIGVVFVTASSRFALEAFAVNALGYILKPYTHEDICRELQKVVRYVPRVGQRITITTIPYFSIRVDGRELHIPSKKSKELLAFFVDRAGIAASSGEIVSCLWPERANDEATGTLLRVTYNRLFHFLEDAGIGHILVSKNRQRWLVRESVDCDLYHILAGDLEAGRTYTGEYLREYSWSESTNARLAKLLNYVEDNQKEN